ncbi:carboxymuconolactone decarboxylase family protein [Streptomyces sp. NBC_00083]|uniref:carboxymuconolactone decarboxylase family protein n=1 Tax=Streptomyces sp. NBC_00083 TaxID=2975647 RepID=UPI002254C3DC|nr:carboxymuconolactone decarboxylase family protein [Streptomyces sp. NBC_00083]MCX5387929.1 carboxymuconolactone decarboxylase family protein [Streptomyces sp. NBC_00083]
MFTEHTLESAPAAAHKSMEVTVRHLGRLTPPVARMATSPHLLDGFLKLNGIFEQTTLDPVAREVLVMTVAVRNECHVCVAMHTGRLHDLGADEELVAALHERRPLADPRLDAVRRFTLAVLAKAGGVEDETVEDFLSYGYTEQNALEVVLGIGTYTLSTFANRLTGAGM